MEDNIFGPTGLFLDSFLFDDVETTSPAEVSLDVDLMSVTENSGKEIKYTFTRKSTSELMAFRQIGRASCRERV